MFFGFAAAETVVVSGIDTVLKVVVVTAGAITGDVFGIVDCFCVVVISVTSDSGDNVVAVTGF